MVKKVFLVLLVVVVLSGLVHAELTKGKLNVPALSRAVKKVAAPASRVEKVSVQVGCAQRGQFPAANRPCCVGLNADNSMGICVSSHCAMLLQVPASDSPCCEGLVPKSLPETGGGIRQVCDYAGSSGGGCAGQDAKINEILLLVRQLAGR